MVVVYVDMLTNSPNVYRYVTHAEHQPSSMATFLSTVREYVALPLKEILNQRGEDGSLATLWAGGMVGFVRGAGEEWLASSGRSEERRVGKACRGQWAAERLKENRV